MAGLGLSEIPAYTIPRKREEEESVSTAQGLGIAPTVQSAAPMAAQPATTAAPLAALPTAPVAEPEEKRGFLQMLGDVGHASKGRETITQRKKREALEAEAVQMERGKLGVSALTTFRDLAKDMPPEAAQQLAKAMGATFNKALPGFEQMAMWSVGDPGAGKFLESLGDAGDVALNMTGGNPVEAERLYREEEWFRNVVDTRGDSRRSGRVMEKLGAAQKRLPSLPAEAIATLPKDANGRPQLTTFGLAAINRFLPEEERLTELEMETINRNPQLAQQFGIQTPEMIEAEGQKRLEQRYSSADTKVDITTETIGDKEYRVGRDKATGKEMWRQEAGETGGSGMTITTTNEDGTTTTVSTGKQTSAQEKEDRQLQDEGVAITNFARESRRLVDQIKSDPGVTSSSRWLVRAGASMAANADAFVRDFKIDTTDLSIPNPITGEQLNADAGLRQQFEKSYPGLAGKTAAYKAAAFNLAYMAAMAKEPGARLSDKDIALNIANLGAQLDDPLSAQDAIMENARFLTDAYKTKIKTKKGKEFTDADQYFKESDAGSRFGAMKDAELEAVDVKSLNPAERKQFRAEIKKRTGQ